jgi:hypothetical protein
VRLGDPCFSIPDRFGDSRPRRLALDGPQPPILLPKDGFLFSDRDNFHASFAADLAGFMVDSQVPWGVDALGGAGHRPCLADQAKLVHGLAEKYGRIPDATHQFSSRTNDEIRTRTGVVG